MALDPSYFFYSDGTITLTNGSDVATGDTVMWDPAVLPFDFVFPNDGTGGMTVIKEVLAVNQIRLAKPWTGPTLTNVPYFMVRWANHIDPRFYAIRVSEYLARLKAIPDNIDEAAAQIHADRLAVDAAMVTLEQIEGDVDADRQAVAADRTATESAASVAAASADEAEAWAQAASSAVLPDNGVTNAKLADMATSRLKGRASAGAGDPEDLTAQQVAELLSEFVFQPGDFKFSTRSTAPIGFLRANGAALSRATYARLWAHAQTSGLLAATEAEKLAGGYGPGDGSTTFTIPDLRGVFFRGFDDNRGIDPGRVIGSEQGQSVENLYAKIALRGQSPQISSSRSVVPSYNTTHTITGAPNAATATQSENLGTDIGSFGTGETRPRNVAYHWFIKY
jgi:microcystin-dependent protein